MQGRGLRCQASGPDRKGVAGPSGVETQEGDDEAKEGDGMILSAKETAEFRSKVLAARKAGPPQRVKPEPLDHSMVEERRQADELIRAGAPGKEMTA